MENGHQAAVAYRERTGHLAVSYGHRELTPTGHSFPLGRWLADQRRPWPRAEWPTHRARRHRRARGRAVRGQFTFRLLRVCGVVVDVPSFPACCREGNRRGESPG
ncbi:helicase associated domain-containing protein [Streptomyces sp. NPDC004014]